MGLIVQKFGGTSVGTPERMRKVAAKIANSYRQGHDLVVVVSAMGHTTDELIELAQQVSQNPPHREMDMLLSAGERISMALLSMALGDFGIPALSLTGSQSGIITDQSHRRARIRRILGDRIRSALSEKKVVIVAGFQGVSETKEITTLGRGGSDTSAVALAIALKAKRCEIFTDVSGVYSADPRVVSSPVLWSEIPHDLMVEMATRGAGVLHPRCVELAKQYRMELVVKTSLDTSESAGTTLVHRQPKDSKAGMEEFNVVGVTSDSTKMWVTLELARSTVVGEVWDRAAQSHLPVIAPVFSGVQVSFYSDRDGKAEWEKILQELVAQEFLRHYQVWQEIVPVSVVGDRFSQDGGALCGLMDVLNRHEIQVSAGCGSALAITVGVSVHHADDAVRALHAEFLER
jgi:aspartate kinase